MKNIEQELIKLGVTLPNDDLLNDPAYNSIKMNKVYLSQYGFTTIDYIVEKLYYSQKQINELKSGDFDINVTKSGNIKMKAVSLYEEIVKERSKAYDDENDVAAYEKITVENVRQEVEGTKSGLIKQIKEKFHYDLNAFDKNMSYEKYKLIKLLYVEHKKNNRIYNILANPSLNSVDNSLVLMSNAYGDIIGNLKNESMKETDIKFVNKVKQSVVNICLDWESIIKEISIKWMTMDSETLTNELIRIKGLSSSILERFPDVNKLDLPYNHSVFETFFLKLEQYESIGRRNDFNKISDYDVVTQGLDVDIELYRKLLIKPIAIENVSEYLSDNKELLKTWIDPYNSRWLDVQLINKPQVGKLLIEYIKLE